MASQTYGKYAAANALRELAKNAKSDKDKLRAVELLIILNGWGSAPTLSVKNLPKHLGIKI